MVSADVVNRPSIAIGCYCVHRKDLNDSLRDLYIDHLTEQLSIESVFCSHDVSGCRCQNRHELGLIRKHVQQDRLVLPIRMRNRPVDIDGPSISFSITGLRFHHEGFICCDGIRHAVGICGINNEHHIDHDTFCDVDRYGLEDCLVLCGYYTATQTVWYPLNRMIEGDV